MFIFQLTVFWHYENTKLKKNNIHDHCIFFKYYFYVQSPSFNRKKKKSFAILTTFSHSDAIMFSKRNWLRNKVFQRTKIKLANDWALKINNFLPNKMTVFNMGGQFPY